MRGLIVGLGSIGKRHLRNCREMLADAELTVLRHRQRETSEPELQLADRVVYILDEALEPLPDFAIIASPAPMHVPVALRLAKRGVHLLVEKPLSHQLAGVDQLLQHCQQQNSVLLVGYTLRFHHCLQTVKAALDEGRIGRLLGIRAEVGQYLPDWRPQTDYRQSVTARRELGGGALLELSHEIDYVRWLGGEIASVQAATAKHSDLEIDVEDWAELILRFESGMLGQIHLDLVQRQPVRVGHAIGSDGTLTWDLISQRVQWTSPQESTPSELSLAAGTARNEIYRDLLTHFLNCIENHQAPACSGADGRRVLEIVLAAQQSAASGTRIEL